mmetsp:Transcript_28216/g.43699  ORF Transcript_28216/g.43699 Transcript_28216/m.43699 type:complete len:185 (+) Transcript_28216:589-1143(+)
MTWIFTALLLVNALKMYQSATGDLQMSLTTWRAKLYRAWGGVLDTETGEHGKAIGRGKKGRCRSCSYFLKHKSTTKRWCTFCQAICVHCDGECKDEDCKVCFRLYGDNRDRSITAHQLLESQGVAKKVYGTQKTKKRLREDPIHPLLLQPCRNQPVSLPNVWVLMNGPVNSQVDGPIDSGGIAA